jgi:hypothetical protein
MQSRFLKISMQLGHQCLKWPLHLQLVILLPRAKQSPNIGRNPRVLLAPLALVRPLAVLPVDPEGLITLVPFLVLEKETMGTLMESASLLKFHYTILGQTLPRLVERI